MAESRCSEKHFGRRDGRQIVEMITATHTRKSSDEVAIFQFLMDTCETLERERERERDEAHGNIECIGRLSL